MILNNVITNICVCVCFYNTNAIYLQECFDSIDLAKSYFEKYYPHIPVNVHVMNDGSNASDTINMFEYIVNSKYKYIKWWHHEKNTTLASAINDLHMYTPSDALVIYIDSDDIMIYNRIVVQYRIMTQYAHWRNITLNATLTNTPVYRTSNNYAFLKYYNYDILTTPEDLSKNIILHNTIAYKINHLHQLNVWYDPQFKCTQDYDFYLNLLKHNCQILLTPDALTWYRQYEDAEKADPKRNYSEEFLKLQKKYNNYSLWDNIFK